MSSNPSPSPLDDLGKLVDEYKRITGGMLAGSITRDDALFAATAAGQRLAEHLRLFAAYATPLLNSFEAMMIEAKRVAAAAATPSPAAPPASPAPAPANPAAGPGRQDVPVVDGVPASPLSLVPQANGEGRP